LIPFKDEETAKEAFKVAKKLCSKDIKKEINKIEQSNISFKNKSNLSFDYSKPKVEPEYIRGYRSNLPILYDDFYIDDNALEEVLKPYINK
jgi:hypothetical protein